jgi:phytoene dehydrogenase-like protein
VTERYDAVVIGAGHNGLVAAVTLAEAGYRVLVLEAAPEPGGALRSAELTRPGYVHDVFATNVNLFLGSAFYASHAGALERHGFAPATSARPYASAFPDGTALGVTTDRDETLEELERVSPRDAAGWRELDALFEQLSPVLLRAYAARTPSWELARVGLEALTRARASGMVTLGRLLLSSARELLDEYLETDKAKALIAPWGLHLDFGPDVAGGAVFPFLEAFADQRGGMAVAKGGASTLVRALVALLHEHGGELRTSTRVTRIAVLDGRAVGVELDTAERIAAARAVVASVTPTALAGDLLSEADLSGSARRALGAYRYGPGTMMLHLSLSAPVPWAAGERLASFAYVHLAPYVDDLARAYADALAGRLPAEPLLVVGQTSVVDPTRVPDGGQILWVQVRPLPAAAPTRRRGGWADAAPRYAERVMQKLERYAPGIGEIVTEMAVLSPADLERADANLVGGDSVSGSMHLRQNFLLRPAWGMSGYRTPVRDLWLIGASTWPGGGLNAVSGYQAAQRILRRGRRAW